MALTQKSKILKEHTLRDHAGWSVTSKMPQVYIHYFGNKSSNSLLEAYGIVKSEQTNNFNDRLLKPKYCPNCEECNKPNAKICIKCKMVLVYDEYLETLEKQEQKDYELEEIKKRMNVMEQGQKELLDLLKHPKELFKILQNE